MKTFKYLLTIAFVAFIFHFVWEVMHIQFYTHYQALEGPLPVPLFAAIGDVIYTLGALLLVCLFKGGFLWLRSPNRADYAGLTILGFCMALLIEYKALVLHRWAYTSAMPLLFGAGVWPLLQMTILLPLSVFLAAVLLKAVDSL